MNIVIIGLSITSSWGNGHATTYRGLVRELAARGHDVVFLERDVPWYSENRDAPSLPYADIRLYRTLEELASLHREAVRSADAVIVGSYVPDGSEVGEWALDVAQGPVCFYDIDTPVTLAAVGRGECAYLSAALIPRYDLYLSFTGGKILERLEKVFGSPRARALYCSVDPAAYHPEPVPRRWDLGYLGTYSADRQPTLDRLLLQVAARERARSFVIAGSQYPEGLKAGENVERISHLPPREHRRFYNEQRFTLNVTRADMIAAGYSPSVRLFEAAACGTPIISDRWEGLDSFFEIGREILVADDTADMIRLLREFPEDRAREMGAAARAKVLALHTAGHRARELEQYLEEVRSGEGRRQEIQQEVNHG